MMHLAQPPPTVLDITTNDRHAVQSLIEQYEPHRNPRFHAVNADTLRVTFPHGFNAENQAVLRQLVYELQALGVVEIKINR